MKQCYMIRDPKTNLYWTRGAQWGRQEFAKVYPNRGRAITAIKRHRSDWRDTLMNQEVEIVTVQIVVAGAETVPAQEMKPC